MAENKLQLLVVESDEELNQRIDKILSRHYTIRTVSAGDDALHLLESGYSPNIILCSQEIPGIEGVDLLVASMEHVPDAIRVIMTENQNAKEIINFINRAHTYIYLRKPVSDIELIQSIKIAANSFHNSVKEKSKLLELQKKIDQLTFDNRELQTKLRQTTYMKNTEAEKSVLLEKKIDKLNQIITNNKSLFIHAVKTLSELIPDTQNYYYNDHYKDLSIISIAIAKTMETDNDTITNIVLASLLFSFVMRQMPEDYILIDPIDLEKDEIDEFFYYYNKILEKFSKVQYFSIPTLILSQIWEHIDGSGYPNKLPGSELLTESKILAIANMYHNNVYRLKPEHKKQLIYEGSITQNVETTRARHDKIIKFLYRRANWFDHEALSNFHSLVKQQIIAPLVPELNSMLTIKYKSDSELVGAISDDIEIRRGIVDKSGDPSKQYDGKITVAEKYLKPKDGSFEVDVPVTKLRDGMVTAENLYNKKGFMVLRSETILSKNNISKIQQLESSGMIDGYISIFTSAPKHVRDKELYKNKWRHMDNSDELGMAERTSNKVKNLDEIDDILDNL